MALRVVFAGTPAFALPTLRALLDAGHEVVGAYTQPDRPAGRGRRPQPSAVSTLASELGIPVIAPQSLQDQADPLARRRPDVMVVVAYGQRLPPAVLAVPRLGCINLHASLLPRWRGAAPVAHAIAAGDERTGVTIIRMDEGMDTGPVLAREEMTILPTDTQGSLQDRLAQVGSLLLVRALAPWAAGTLQPVAQDEALASQAPRLSKAWGRVDWTSSAVAIERHIRACDPWPGAHCWAGTQRWRLWQARAEAGDTRAPPGTVLATGRDGIRVQSGQGRVCIRRLQAAGGRPMAAGEFLNGARVEVGWLLGGRAGVA